VFLDKIFDAFEQLEMRREGLGLGLAISKALVEMHGGSIRAQSEGRGKGSTFTVTLPVVP
jgi:signal transduction histidine kinase